jgi:hypothetical protein
MTRIYSDDEAGLKHGSRFKLLKSSPTIKTAEQRILPVGEIIVFDYAGNNHWDDIDTYCFLSKEGEKIFILFDAQLSRQEKLEQLFKEYLEPIE